MHFLIVNEIPAVPPLYQLQDKTMRVYLQKSIICKLFIINVRVYYKAQNLNLIYLLSEGHEQRRHFPLQKLVFRPVRSYDRRSCPETRAVDGRFCAPGLKSGLGKRGPRDAAGREPDLRRVASDPTSASHEARDFELRSAVDVHVACRRHRRGGQARVSPHDIGVVGGVVDGAGVAIEAEAEAGDV